MPSFQPIRFPDPNQADAEGLVAVSRRLSPALVLAAYSQGIFPWSDRPVGWYSPDPRAVFEFDRIHIPKRTMRVVRQKRFQVTFDRAFRAVMEGCRTHHERSWISEGFVDTYGQLHRQGYAHSVEVWRDGLLVGGLYGLQLSGTFAGESMFYRAPEASKVAFVHLVRKLREVGVVLLDAQVLTPHTQRLGAREIPRPEFLERLRQALALDLPPRPWCESGRPG